jgi:hypothetical protein
LVVARVKDWLVVVTVRLTVVVSVVAPLVPVTVIACALDGNAMFAAVVMVRTTVDADEPLSVTLEGLKLQSAPAGRFAVQLPGFDVVELVKLTAPVNPLVGVMVIVEVAVCPAGMLKAEGLADMVNGAITVTTAGGDVEALSDASPSKVAVTLFEPGGSRAVENVAVPAERVLGLFRVAVPKTDVEPLLVLEKLTVPTAVEGVTVAVKVTLVP